MFSAGATGDTPAANSRPPAFARAGAFRFASSTSRDAALLLTLDPGAYTLQATSPDGSVDSLLGEAYEVP